MDPALPYKDIDPTTMTDGELERTHTSLSLWIENALDPSCDNSEETFELVYAYLTKISQERALRQWDDRLGRPLKPIP